MFKRKTVFVIGAGCSNELNLPLGAELITNIRATIEHQGTPDYMMVQGGFIRSGVPNAHMDMERKITNLRAGIATAPSIDQYLDFHKKDAGIVALGKVAIANEIMKAESTSKLSKNMPYGVPDCWLQWLFHLMMDGTSRERPADILKNVAFITFNYDRVIEVFLLRALTLLAEFSHQEAAALLRDVPIIHPYGSVGEPFLAQPGIATDRMAFDAERIEENDVAVASKRLRTFTEGCADEEVRSTMTRVLREAQQVIFLGFGYIEQNLELLSIARPVTADTILGTSLGMSERVRSLVTSQVKRALWPQNGLYYTNSETNVSYQHTASGFFGEMGRTLRL